MTLTIQDVRLHLTDRGSGIPTLFLHGVPDSADLWDGLIARMEASYRCLAPDLPGMGRSTAPPAFDCSLENVAGLIDRMLDAHGIREPVNLIVHDFGGPYGLVWAISHPERVRRIAIFNTNFFADYRWHWTARLWRTPVLGEVGMALMSAAALELAMRGHSPALTREHIRHTFALSMARPAVRRTILRLYRTLDPKGLAPWEARLPELTARVPTCVLWGDRDPYIPAATADRFGAKDVFHFSQYGHWLPAEAPDSAAQPLLAFLA